MMRSEATIKAIFLISANNARNNPSIPAGANRPVHIHHSSIISKGQENEKGNYYNLFSIAHAEGLRFWRRTPRAKPVLHYPGSR